MSVDAASPPQLIINDNLKQCSEYSLSSYTDIPSGWHTSAQYIPWQNWESYCSSLKYTFVQNIERVPTMQAVYYPIVQKYTPVVLYIVLLLVVFVYARRYIFHTKRYLLFVNCLLMTFLILKLLSNVVVYSTNPCHSYSSLLNPSLLYQAVVGSNSCPM